GGVINCGDKIPTVGLQFGAPIARDGDAIVGAELESEGAEVLILGGVEGIAAFEVRHGGDDAGLAVEAPIRPDPGRYGHAASKLRRTGGRGGEILAVAIEGNRLALNTLSKRRLADGHGVKPATGNVAKGVVESPMGFKPPGFSRTAPIALNEPKRHAWRIE